MKWFLYGTVETNLEYVNIILSSKNTLMILQRWIYKQPHSLQAVNAFTYIQKVPPNIILNSDGVTILEKKIFFCQFVLSTQVIYMRDDISLICLSQMHNFEIILSMIV